MSLAFGRYSARRPTERGSKPGQPCTHGINLRVEKRTSLKQWRVIRRPVGCRYLGQAVWRVSKRAHIPPRSEISPETPCWSGRGRPNIRKVSSDGFHETEVGALHTLVPVRITGPYTPPAHTRRFARSCRFQCTCATSRRKGSARIMSRAMSRRKGCRAQGHLG